jgi:CheY-like chemotaxis protein
LNILLADDDIDDCIFFKKVLDEMELFIHLAIVNDGEQLMKYLFENPEYLPDILFLDLNMPRKNGFECLCEIKENELTKDISVVMFSTSYPVNPDYENDMINRLLQIGAFQFVRKSHDLEQIKATLQKMITIGIEKKMQKKNR